MQSHTWLGHICRLGAKRLNIMSLLTGLGYITSRWCEYTAPSKRIGVFCAAALADTARGANTPGPGGSRAGQEGGLFAPFTVWEAPCVSDSRYKTTLFEDLPGGLRLQSNAPAKLGDSVAGVQGVMGLQPCRA